MRKVLLLLVCLSSSLTLSGCSSVLSLFPRSMDSFSHIERFWKNKYTGQLTSSDLVSVCFSQAIDADLMSKNLPLDDLWEESSVYRGYAQCLSSQGYVFTANLFDLYCYHPSNELECNILKSYK